jgi:c-di-GMP-binding flagellar brake protein YcgR
MPVSDPFPIHDLAAISVTEPRRRAGRCGCSLRVTYTVIMRPQLAPLPATGQDISQGGIGMRVGAPLTRGTLLGVKLFTSCGRRFLSRQAQVRHVRPGPAGTWLVGLTFGRPLSCADLDMVLARADASMAS